MSPKIVKLLLIDLEKVAVALNKERIFIVDRSCSIGPVATATDQDAGFAGGVNLDAIDKSVFVMKNFIRWKSRRRGT